jgi:hypothetical protein
MFKGVIVSSSPGVHPTDFKMFYLLIIEYQGLFQLADFVFLFCSSNSRAVKDHYRSQCSGTGIY